ncbi:hypothetical protein FNH05_01670 [Amycolatopsis rhizosphaerae]|uniref:ImmA/IrrE family metallo-endopeptidase n=1 Tax=Amycolatopsis rhizosphaerae TaxID=2053003 RepID=A0A558DLS6_9PSEU|nr:hypothetical protein [Amycolatopsis rhizosphaerae]TVT61967.1 hypothetical protein FNH05_01670 [Amycolatopsis rhizosphaerae]
MISTLPIPRPFDLDRFLEALAEERGKRIKLVLSRLGPDQPCGMLISTTEADYIYCAVNVPPLQSQHVVMHEVGHLLFNHGTARSGFGETPRVAGADALAVLLPNLSPELVQRILGRTIYASDQEREAELFASLVLTRISGAKEVYSGPPPDSPVDLALLESAFGHPVRPGSRHG